MERKTLLWLAVAWSILIGIACLLEGSSIPQVPMIAIPFKDKIAHFVFYFVFSFLWFFYLDRSKKGRSDIKNAILVFIVASLMGGTVEILQLKFTTSRSAEWTDMIANCSGSFISLVFCLSIKQFRK